MVALAEVLAQNSLVTDIPSNGHRPPATPSVGSTDQHGAVPVPDLAVADDVSDVLSAFGGIDLSSGPTAPPGAPRVGSPPSGPVTDEDRNRFGLLLDRAAERGLLDHREYEVRLGELAAASSVEEMRDIVTELPILTTPPPSATSPRGRGVGRSPLAGTRATSGGGRRSSPWLVLVVLVVVLVAALAFFAVYAGHIVHTRNTGLDLRAWSTRPLSALRS
jgi:Domain of unknown function (DUF1707)